uniref:Uncharacterized protein n=1 Tax=Arundo donax TaxID=35708 RepID=A0A0A9PA31_ARUDO
MRLCQRSGVGVHIIYSQFAIGWYHRLSNSQVSLPSNPLSLIASQGSILKSN